MKPSFFLRAAAVLSLLYFLGHTMGRPWTPVHTPEGNAVVDAMRTQRFQVFGAPRSYWDFYQGFGLAISVHLLAQSVLFWLLAPLARVDPVRVRPLVALFLLAILANGFLAARYFFPLPASFSAAIAVCLALALLTSPRRSTRDASGGSTRGAARSSS
jgi:hypothetical protein